MLTDEQTSSLAEVHGPSFYLVDIEKFRKNFFKLLDAFKTHYSNTKIAYSYKTNYLPNLCAGVNQLGGYAEVVSSMEMELAQRLNILNSNIFFNGPIKGAEAVSSLLLNGGTVNIDSLDEFITIVRWLEQAQVDQINLGIRCNFDVMFGANSRFGLDPKSSEFKHIMNECVSHPNINLTGFHCHFASRTIESWTSRATEMGEFLHQVPDQIFAGLKQISMGGGMSGEMPDEMQRQFRHNIPTFEEYATAAAVPFAKLIQLRGGIGEPELIIEPGTALAANVVNFVCSIASIKEIRGETIITTSGSVYNINPAPNRINMPIRVIPRRRDRVVKSVSGARLVGFTCIETDCLYHDFLGQIAVGDLLWLEQVGAYSIVMKPPFILPNVAIIEFDRQTEQSRVIKRAETFDDVFATYNMRG
jgi:diaminopimelate decarboxylase